VIVHNGGYNGISIEEDDDYTREDHYVSEEVVDVHGHRHSVWQLKGDAPPFKERNRFEIGAYWEGDMDGWHGGYLNEDMVLINEMRAKDRSNG
jgi:hypothetical protein